MAVIDRRYICYGYNCGGYSSWDSWIRWLVLGLIIGGALLIFLAFSCITARRRRKMGYAPYRGTGWVSGIGGRNNNMAHPGNPPETNYGQYQQPYYPQQSQTYNAPPAYGQGAAGDYYGRGQNNIELQQPQPAYGAYAPPAGPPPGKY